MKKKVLFMLILAFLSVRTLAQEVSEEQMGNYNLFIEYQNHSSKCILINPSDIQISERIDEYESPIKQRCRELFQEMGTLALVVIDEDYEHIFLYLNDPLLGKEDPYYVDFEDTEYTYRGKIQDLLPMYMSPRIKGLLSEGRINRIIKLCGISYRWDEDTCTMFSDINYKKLVRMLNKSAEWFHRDYEANQKINIL